MNNTKTLLPIDISKSIIKPLPTQIPLIRKHEMYRGPSTFSFQQEVGQVNWSTNADQYKLIQFESPEDCMAFWEFFISLDFYKHIPSQHLTDGQRVKLLDTLRQMNYTTDLAEWMPGISPSFNAFELIQLIKGGGMPVERSGLFELKLWSMIDTTANRAIAEQEAKFAGCTGPLSFAIRFFPIIMDLDTNTTIDPFLPSVIEDIDYPLEFKTIKRLLLKDHILMSRFPYDLNYFLLFEYLKERTPAFTHARTKFNKNLRILNTDLEHFFDSKTELEEFFQLLRDLYLGYKKGVYKPTRMYQYSQASKFYSDTDKEAVIEFYLINKFER